MHAVLYARVSTDSEDQETSPPNQLERCRQLCALRGWQVVAEFTDTMSGTRLDRTGFTAAVAMLRRGEAQVLVADTLQRIARTTDFLRFLRDEIQPHGDIATRDGGFDTTTASGRFIMGVLLSAYQYQVEQSAEQIRATNALKRSKGMMIGGQPFGSKSDGNGGRVRDPATYPELLAIFTRAAAGEPHLRIAADLRRRGVPTVLGGSWWQSTIHSMLKCRWYLGEIVHDGKVVAHTQHDCMIPAELWQAAQPGNKRGRPGTYVYLLQGLVVSSHWRYVSPPSKVGRPVSYVGHVDSKRKPGYRRQDHNALFVAEKVDDATGMPGVLAAPELELAVVTKLIELGRSDELLTRARANATQLIHQAQADVARLRKAQQKAETALQRAQGRLIRALDTESREALRALDSQAAEARREAERVAEQLLEAESRAQAQIAVLPETVERVNMIEGCWTDGKRAELKVLIAAVVEQVDVRGDGIRLILKPVLRVGEINIQETAKHTR